MTSFEHTIEIDRPLSEVFELARQVERYPEFLPGYRESRIVEEADGRMLLARTALVRGKLHAWKSWVTFLGGRAIHFEHAAGPLKGMQVWWRFHPQGPRTFLSIIHILDVRRRGLLGRLFEKVFFAPRVSEMASVVITSFKRACERQP